MQRFVDVFETARLGTVCAGELDPRGLARLAGTLAGEGGSLAFDWRGRVDEHGRPAGRLSLDGLLPLRCDRCQGVLHWAFDVQRSYYFVRTERELAGLPVDDVDEEPLLGSARFDLIELVEDEVILSLPLSPRHDDCTGPRASGSDADAEGAAPATDGRASPFAALATLRKPGAS